METIKFYKDVNNLWVLGDYASIYAGSVNLIKYAEETINFEKNGTAMFYPNLKISQLVNSLNEKYVADGTDFDDAVDLLKSATAEFFKKTTDASVLTKLDNLNIAVTNSGGSTLKSFSVEITRPANQTPYTAGDVVADTTAAFIPFANVAKAIGTGVKIVRVRIQTDDTAVAGTKFNVHLYKDAPTFIADNAAFAVAYANATKRVGAIPVVMGTGNLGTVGMNDYNIAMCNPVARNIYFIIETVTGFTASANSTKFTITIDCELSNN